MKYVWKYDIHNNMSSHLSCLKKDGAIVPPIVYFSKKMMESGVRWVGAVIE